MLATRECALLAMVRTRDIDPAITVRQAPGGDPQMAGPFTDQALWARIIRQARCADGTDHPEQWFPVNADKQGPARGPPGLHAVCLLFDC
jgi:hypothetical protein